MFHNGVLDFWGKFEKLIQNCYNHQVAVFKIDLGLKTTFGGCDIKGIFTPSCLGLSQSGFGIFHQDKSRSESV